MTKEQFFDFMKYFYENNIEISKRKNADYTGNDDNPFSNFESVQLLGIKNEHGMLTRMLDKFKRIASFVNQGSLQVQDESAIDSLADLANYCAIMAAYLRSKNPGATIEEWKSIDEDLPF